MSNFLSNKKLRNLHRDAGYLFVGLIVAFAIAGIALNHRKQWKPDKYSYDYKKIETNFRLPKESITKENIDVFSKQYDLKDFKQFDIRKDSTLIIAYKDADANIKLLTGKGEINMWKKKPVLAQMVFLHKFNNNNWWLLYSDIFAGALIFIAVSGLFLMKGKYSFRKRGWWLMFAGLIVPTIMLAMFY
ncbi:MAG: PepSY-associated TM helix domain-containing protein [Bacteroidetes bacterium]|nr:PepSY-associated TM helix domain-containing protein [Bacteroidota bacterium]